MKKYTGIVKFIAEHDNTYGNITVEINFDEKLKDNQSVNEVIKEMVEFWAGYESLVNHFEGDYVKAFLKNLCCKILGMLVEYPFADEERMIELMSKEEGYCSLDGSFGITLVDFEEMNFSDEADYTIKEV